jgi:NAD(P)-dependent dehydrogenase (short-subunit alcohol dehydrogenase family)
MSSNASGDLANKVIFLTGGGQGIGRECALAYANAGASVVVADINQEAAQSVVEKLASGEHMAVSCDVSHRDSVDTAVQSALKRYGRLDAVHNNAGISTPAKPIHETSEAEWDKLQAVNLKSVYLTTCAAFEALKASKGCILNTASLVGEIGQSDHAAYVATKGGMIALTKALALDYAPYGIRANAICPAGVWTPLLREWVSQQPAPAQMETYLNDIHALGYCPDGDVIADVAVFLLSQRARFMTGAIIPVSGGAELGYRR